MRNYKIIHKHILKDGDYFYLCNQTVSATWRKTDITNQKVNCKNCLKQLKHEVIKREKFGDGKMKKQCKHNVVQPFIKKGKEYVVCGKCGKIMECEINGLRIKV